MKINKEFHVSKKLLNILYVIAGVLITIFLWEYYCATRPYGQCGSVCEKRSYVAAMMGNKPIDGYTCSPWYRWYQR